MYSSHGRGRSQLHWRMATPEVWPEVKMLSTSYFCIFLVFFFGYELLIEVGLLHNEGDYRIVIGFFSTAMFEMISKAFWYIVEHVTKLAYAIAHCFTVVCDYLFVCVVCNSCKQGSKILQYMWPGIYCLCYSSLCILYRFNHGALPFFCRSR